METREQYNPHEVLGVSPTCEPELIDAAYQALIRKYRRNDSESDRLRAINAAYASLKSSQRREEHDPKGASAAAPMIGTDMWQVKPRSRPQPVVTRPPEIAPSPEPSFAPHARGDGIASPSARHWTIADWSNDQPPSQGEPPLPADEPVEDPMPDERSARSRYATPVAAGLGVIGAALLTALLTDQSPPPRSSEARREAAVPAKPRPITRLQSTLQTSEEVPKVAENRQPAASRPQAAVAPASVSSQDTAIALKRSAVAQSAPTAADPARSIAASAIPVSPVPAPQITNPASQPATERPPQQVEPPRAVTAMPARWISGGLQDSDNRNGRFVGSVAVRITVRPNGRPGGCRIAHSSGNPGLDETTCRLLGERLLFSPAHDAAGRPVESEVGTTYVWGRRVRR